ncbi:hypothetical protein O3Q51_13980 [Cryomorphaceae bacterium 1068]|nr:hypothetical protein [Cryomorphaceae bacterium 1068]
MKKYLALFLIPFFAISCNSDDKDSNSPADPTPKNTIELDNIQEGQINRYLRYTADCSDPEGSFAYSGDTLVVEIHSTTEGLVFYEEFTEGSTNFGGLEPSETRVISREGYILIPERQFSQLFFFYGNDTIYLTKPEDLNLNQGTCFIEYENGEPFIGEEIGFLPTFNYQDIDYQNNRIVSCVPPIILNLDAYLIYDESQLKMSHTLRDMGTSFSIDGYTLLR